MPQTINDRYNTQANVIINESIKSAVFIDEKALEFYTNIPKNNEIRYEEKLSIDLFKNFKSNGISLTVHKFKPSDTSNENIKKFLFEDRDLVLLDWKLDGLNGEKYSLELLSDIVKRPHIHFCTIYTSENSYDDIFNNIVSFFSGKNKSYYDGLFSHFTELYENEEEFKRIIDNCSIYDYEIENNKRFFSLISSIDQQLLRDISIKTGFKPEIGLKHIRIALTSHWHKSDVENSAPDSIDKNHNAIFINNTIVTILNKDENKPKHLIKKLSKQISTSKNSFTKLLGIEMHNLISKSAAFIDHNLLNVSVDTLLYHRKQLTQGGDDLPFDTFIKSVLIEHTNINLRSENLKLLNSSFLDSITKSRFKPSSAETALINTFYNGTFINKGNRNINFGDIFISDNQEYYLCITALCDCHIFEGKSNIKYKYFFVKGLPIQIDTGIALGDGGFISYLSDSICISWTGGGANSFYAKPLQLYIPNPSIIDNRLDANDWHNTRPIPLNLKYVFTLRQQYAQRIANHAFAHPVRVGVDFVKIPSQ